jgi:hypothetical protein
MVEKATPSTARNPAEDVLGGGVRGEVAGCPTGLSEEWQPPAQPEGQGAEEPRSDGQSREARPGSDKAG